MNTFSSVTRSSPELCVVVPCYNERANVALMVEKLDTALAGIGWEVVFVDDDSPDGTAAEVRRIAATDIRVRCILRVGRRGLASAVIEGALSTSAKYVAVIDGDLQHDETRLPVMLAALRDGSHDLAVGSRHVDGGDSAGLSSPWRHRLSTTGIKVAQRFLPVTLNDPMSGFFMLPQGTFERLAPRLTGQGFKILLDLVLSAPMPLRVLEVPFKFQERVAGESKLDVLVLTQFAGLLIDKIVGGFVPLRFISFALVGTLGVAVHLASLTLMRADRMITFGTAQIAATLIAMAFNFYLNNQITYRNERLRGPRLWRGLLLFICVCSIGAVANVSIADLIFATGSGGWIVSGTVGAMIGAVWNYAVASTLVWRVR